MAEIVQLRALTFLNVKDYGATGNGTTDDTTAIAAAITAATTAGGGVVFFPAGTYLSGNQTLSAQVYLQGAGIGATTIKLKAGSNTDLFSGLTSSINLSAAAQAGSNTAITNFGFRHMTLDGNKANQTAGTSYPLRVYGHRHILEHVEILNGYSGGILMDFNGNANPTPPANQFMPHWYDVSVHDNNGIGIQIGGPTDMMWFAVTSWSNGSHCVHLAPNCVALRMNSCHFWAAPVGVSAVSLLNEAPGLAMNNCQIEGSDTCALVLLANDCHGGDLEIGTVDALRAGRGIQFGQNAGNTPIPGQIYQSAGHTTAASCIDTLISAKIFGAVAGALDEENTSGNIYSIIAYQTSGTAISSNGGYLVASSSGLLRVVGLTADGTQGKGGAFLVGANNTFNAFQFFNPSSQAIFNIDSRDGSISTYRGTTMGFYTDGGSTYGNFFQSNANGQIWFGNGFDTYVQKNGTGTVQIGTQAQLGTGSTLSSGSGAPSNANGANGDYYFRTDTPGTANQRIYVKSAGAWVGIV